MDEHFWNPSPSRNESNRSSWSPGQNDVAKNFKPAVRSLPRLTELIGQGLGSDSRVKLKLPPPEANAGKVLRWAKDIMQGVLDKGPTVYKIGLTGNPSFRFYKNLRGPRPHQATFMTGTSMNTCTFFLLELLGMRPLSWKLS